MPSEEEALVEQVVASMPKIEATPLAKFDKWKEQLAEIDLATGPLAMRQFLHAYEWTTKACIQVQKRLHEAKEDVKHEQAKATLERFSDYREKNKDKLVGLKDSAALREMYLALDEPYRKAVAKVHALTALAKFMDNKAESYRMAHDDAKKIYSSLIGVPSSNGSYGFPRGGFGDTSE